MDIFDRIQVEVRDQLFAEPPGRAAERLRVGQRRCIVQGVSADVWKSAAKRWLRERDASVALARYPGKYVAIGPKGILAVADDEESAYDAVLLKDVSYDEIVLYYVRAEGDQLPAFTW